MCVSVTGHGPEALSSPPQEKGGKAKMNGQNEPNILRQKIERLRALLMGINDERARRVIHDRLRETQAALDEVENKGGRC